MKSTDLTRECHRTDERFSIGALSARIGVSASAIRYYEQVGVMPRPHRVSGRRAYDASAMISLSAIRCARDAGFTLREIRSLLPLRDSSQPLSVRWRRLATEKISEIDTTILRLSAVRDLLRSGLECNCLALDDCTMFRAHADAPKSQVRKRCQNELFGSE